MFNRIISLALIAAVFGCPLWCSMGFCHCSGDMMKVSAKADSCCQPSCCGTASESKTPPAPGAETPDSNPEGLRCQGICGGAVFESPCQLPAAELCRFLSCVDSDASLLLAKQHSIVRNSDFPEFPRAENQGRSVRIRLMSFQC